MLSNDNNTWSSSQNRGHGNGFFFILVQAQDQRRELLVFTCFEYMMELDGLN